MNQAEQNARIELIGQLGLLKDKTGRDNLDRAHQANFAPGNRRVVPGQLQDLSMSLPLTKRQKQLAQDLGLASYQTRRARGAYLDVVADATQVEAFVEACEPFASPEELVGKMAGRMGYSSKEHLTRAGKRVARYMNQWADNGRIPRHIQLIAVHMDALAAGVKLAFPAAYAAGAGLAEPA